VKDRSIFRAIFWALIGLAFLFFTLGGWYFSGEIINDAFAPDPEAYVVPSDGYELEEVSYTSELGEFDALYLPAPTANWVIHVHGKGATPAEAEPLFAALQDAGYQQLAITYRNDDGAPVDESGYYQYGATEWQDVSAAVDYALENGATQIVLSGFSTGAAHIMAYQLNRSSAPVIGFLFDAPNIDMGRTVDFARSQRDLPLLGLPVPAPLGAVAKFLTSLRIDVNWKSIDYLEKADLLIRRPVLVHHGTADQTVPVGVSRDLAKAVPDLVTFIEVPDAGHVESYDVDLDKYLDEVLGFLGQISAA
jgi:fermentation-respiration switch protein FrsA (DUF1100 family)